ncbi:KilA-N domain-containing protein [Corallococcus silvisoli]|uniref:KilA-N domain-containing protein n=1 Tax=Corallococcus silvisoli TaxID=2697031 RepID=UPI0013782536|nr:KilA-N domain-containing protein [Corallococcus silvisoli]NBD11849.1 hypothetical protein [Corallococcus silvisoli]
MEIVMSCQPSSIQVAGVVITQDAHGRYSLNDLHRAAGAELRHQPSNFLRLDATREMVAALTRSSDLRNGPVESIRGGPNQGTYVCEDLVYDYAMWVSAEFRVKVIQVFKTHQRGSSLAPVAPAFAVPKTLPEALRLAADLAEQVEAQQAQLVAQKPDVDLARRYLDSEGRDRCLLDAATALCIPPNTFYAALESEGFCYRRPGLNRKKKKKNRLLPHAEFVTKGYLVNRARLAKGAKGVERDVGQTMVTRAGMAFFHHRFAHLSTRQPEQLALLDA